MEKWFAMELSRNEWTDIRPILKKFACQYEASECGALIHVEVYCTPDTAEAINAEL